MKKIVFLMCLLGLFFIPIKVKAEVVNVYLFFGEECPVCEKEKQFLNEIKNKYENIKIYYYEVWHNPENSKKLEEVSSLMDVSVNGVPFTVVGDRVLKGYNDKIGKRIEEIILEYTNTSYDDKVGRFLQVETARKQIELKEELQVTTLNDVEKTDKSKNLIIILFIVLLLFVFICIILYDNYKKKK